VRVLPDSTERLLHASKRLDDPGIETPAGTAPTFDQLKAYFADLINRLEQEEAAGAFGGAEAAPETTRQVQPKRRAPERKRKK
jgi:hypothetical protein